MELWRWTYLDMIHGIPTTSQFQQFKSKETAPDIQALKTAIHRPEKSYWCELNKTTWHTWHTGLGKAHDAFSLQKEQ